MNETNKKQDELMTVMQDPEKLELLYDLWRIVRHTPTRAAEILVEFKDTQTSMRNMISDLQETISRFDILRERLPDIKEVSQVLKDTTRDLAGTDEKALNRLSRIVEAADTETEWSSRSPERIAVVKKRYIVYERGSVTKGCWTMALKPLDIPKLPEHLSEIQQDCTVMIPAQFTKLENAEAFSIEAHDKHRAWLHGKKDAQGVDVTIVEVILPD